jgi:tetratricopeptide (TPR) repeat protein
MKRTILFTCLLAAFLSPDLFSQSKQANRTSFYDAESWIVFEDYAEALKIYQDLLKIFPENYNYKYRIGQCYLSLPGEKAKSISYLEEASKHINPKYKENNFNETGAPYDVLYYLANAYRINNQFEKATETYKLFRKNLDPNIYDSTLVDFQIQTCTNAQELMKVPIFIKLTNLGKNINESKSEFNPVISEKEDLLVFSKKEAFYDAILYSVKTNGNWSPPQNMNEILKVDRDYFPTSLSKDGKELYLYSSTDYDGIIYTSRFEKGVWSPLVKLNDNINTKYWESHATVSHDNKKLYFTSNRKGSLGGLDIYVSVRDSSGDWGPAKNLGPVINTPYNEESPFLSADDKTLFFSSRGHFNIGGYDIFNSTLQPNGQWSAPLNIGYPMNTTDDEMFFSPLKEGYEGYMAREKSGGFGALDIYRIEVFTNNHPRKFIVKGMAKFSDLLANNNDSIKVSAMNVRNPDQTIIVYTDPKTGEYEFELPQGSYQIIYEGKEAQKFSRAVELSLTQESDILILPATMLLMNEKAVVPEEVKPAPVKEAAPVVIPLLPAKKKAKPVVPETKVTPAPVAEPVIAKPDTITKVPQPALPVPSGKEKGRGVWLYWLLPGALLFIFFILFWRRRKKKKEGEE